MELPDPISLRRPIKSRYPTFREYCRQAGPNPGLAKGSRALKRQNKQILALHRDRKIAVGGSALLSGRVQGWGLLLKLEGR